jgi:hypothetical protein
MRMISWDKGWASSPVDGLGSFLPSPSTTLLPPLPPPLAPLPTFSEGTVGNALFAASSMASQASCKRTTSV